MSYLTENVGGDPLDEMAISDLSSVGTASPSDGQLMEYSTSSSAWSPATKTFEDGALCFSFWHRTGTTWRSTGGSGFAYATNSGASPPTELMQAAHGPTDKVILTSSTAEQYNWGLWKNWYKPNFPRFSGVYVPPGTWYCRAAIPGSPWLNSGYALVRWATGPATGSTPTTASLTPVGPTFYIAPAKGRFTHIPTYIIKTTADSTLLCLEFVGGSSYQYEYAGYWLKYYTFHVTQIGN